MATATDTITDAKPGDDAPAAGPTVAPRRGDPTPKRRGPGGARPGAGRPKGSKTGAGKAGAKRPTAAPKTTTTAQDDAKLTANLRQLLELPILPARQVGFAFAVAHFSEAAEPTAKMIVAASHTWPELRSTLLNADSLVSGKVLFAAAIVGYLAPVGAYLAGQHGLAYGIGRADPAQVDSIQVMLGMPPELAAAIQQAREQGATDAVLAGMVDAYRARTQTPQQPVPHPGSPAPRPTAPGTTAASPTS